MTIAVDFDGTIVEHRYPQIGEIPFATATLKMLINERHRLILWSVREGEAPGGNCGMVQGTGVWNSMPSTGTIRKKTSHTRFSRKVKPISLSMTAT